MRLPKLTPRPQSLQSCAAFGGLCHSPTAPIGLWYDSRNLTSDMSPTACARRSRDNAASIVGNTPFAPIVAMCEGEHIVLLDATGTFWCNGHNLTIEYGGSAKPILHWEISITKPVRINVAVSPAGGDDATWGVLNHLGLRELPPPAPQLVVQDNPYSEHNENGGSQNHLSLTAASQPRYIVDQHIINFRCRAGEQSETGVIWEYDLGEAWTPCDLADFNISLTVDDWGGFWVSDDPAALLLLLDGLEFQVIQYATSSELLRPGHRLIRMGAKVIDVDAGCWLNAAKLATGQIMWADADYGFLGIYDEMMEYRAITLTICDIDGNDYTGVTVSATEPAGHGLWLDTSGQEPALREWAPSTSMWVNIPSTYVKIHTTGGANYELMHGLKAFDTVNIYAAVPDETDESVKKILNGAHYIYNIVDSGVEYDYDLIVAGILNSDSITVNATEDHRMISIVRAFPQMDYVVEAGNRLWGCRYDEDEGINEIYASKLGDPTNWEVFQGLSTDSWRSSRGTAAPFTGAAVLDGHPLFFRETSLEKVYPSASGAHQIQTFDLEGVEQGAADSLCVIEDRLFYKSPGGIMVYTGTMPRRISQAFGNMAFHGGSAARHDRKYCLSTTPAGAEEQVVLVYDLETGDWHIETEAWKGKAVTWKDNLYYIHAGKIFTMAKSSAYGCVSWWAETGPQAIRYSSARRASLSVTEHKWISCIRVRYRMLENGTRQTNDFRVLISYEDGPWELKKEIHGAAGPLRTRELNIFPKRKDNFRLRFEGSGPTQIFDIAWHMERSEGGH